MHTVAQTGLGSRYPNTRATFRRPIRRPEIPGIYTARARARGLCGLPGTDRPRPGAARLLSRHAAADSWTPRQTLTLAIASPFPKPTRQPRRGAKGKTKRNGRAIAEREDVASVRPWLYNYAERVTSTTARSLESSCSSGVGSPSAQALCTPGITAGIAI